MQYLNKSFNSMDTAEKMSKEVAEYFEWMLKENHFKFFKKGEFQVDDFQSEVETVLFDYLEDEHVTK
jgi:hypothetical protein